MISILILKQINSYSTPDENKRNPLYINCFIDWESNNWLGNKIGFLY